MYQMKQPKVKILSTGEIYDVVSLVRLDEGKTLRVFPRHTSNGILSYVVYTNNPDETEPNAELIFE